MFITKYSPKFGKICEYLGDVFNGLEANFRMFVGSIVKNLIVQMLCHRTATKYRF